LDVSASTVGAHTDDHDILVERQPTERRGVAQSFPAREPTIGDATVLERAAVDQQVALDAFHPGARHELCE
jgi:hypothetical protein